MRMNPYEPPKLGVSSAQSGPLPVRATGILTPNDVQRALKAAGNRGMAIKAVVAVAFLLALVGIALMAARGRWIEVWVTAFELAALIVVGSLLFVFLRWRLLASWNARPENRHAISWTFSNDGLLIETTHGKQLHYWNNFIYATIPADKVILAHHGGTTFNFVPRRFFETDEDWNAVCQLLALKLPVRQATTR